MVAKSELLQRAYGVKTPEDVKDVYKDWAKTYDRDLSGDDLGYVAPREAVAVFQRFFSDKRAHVLDVGCGTGLSGQALDEAGFAHFDGLDLTPEMLEQARQKNIYEALHQGDLTAKLDIPDDTYDAALSVGTFTHGHVGPDGLDEMIRIVKPGGVVCVTVNEGVFEKLDYPKKIASLQNSGTCDLLEQVETAYLTGENIRSQVVCLRVL